MRSLLIRLAIMFTVSQWAAPLLAGSTSSLPASGSAPSPTLHPEALLEGSRSPSPVYSRRSSMLEEDTFTHGGVYIGSLQSHIRAHSGLCRDQNVRSQGCQTGEEEVSPPVVEWRVLPPTPTQQEALPLPAPSAEMADIGVQCCAGMEATSPSPRDSKMALAGEMDRLVVYQNSSQVVAKSAAPAFLLSLVQALLGIPLPLIGLALQLMDTRPVWGWRVTLTALAFTSPSPALAHCAYLWAAASTGPLPSDI
ncbi:hypothetical protein O3P69_009436 [Scylla paramamosain]|uniref:Uncharacterized protein n=1 Tax=Scylla paramamosain TaxID=85552 RepID=A0AAW0SUQ1_SCYPA